jgi:C-terminal processing protease CtpA/Prc
MQKLKFGLQIGVILNGTTILDTIVGGPGYNSRQLAAKDVILKIDGAPVTSANINSVMTGSDIAGSPVMLTIAKGGFEVYNKICAF